MICPAPPRAPSGLIYFTRKRSSAAENSPIRNKLVGRQLTGGNSDRSPPRCVGTSDAPLPSRKQDDFGSRWPIGNEKRACFRPAPGSSAIWKWDPTRGSGRYTALAESALSTAFRRLTDPPGRLLARTALSSSNQPSQRLPMFSARHSVRRNFVAPAPGGVVD